MPIYTQAALNTLSEGEESRAAARRGWHGLDQNTTYSCMKFQKHQFAKWMTTLKCSNIFTSSVLFFCSTIMFGNVDGNPSCIQCTTGSRTNI